ncbi:ABC transporter permease [Luteibacter sp. 22Crub2.1]|uniref:ABC transporter permease n=1 Tax=Luteibacter sp. 22Crub2.1 TaxID=1283288 RepID=UPI0009A85D7F|nr:ABC transporter permease [Luteibacter sp. 22Crub2.1]SKB31915.1 osmoprotectant transport system permease protein [Luteibacter sp. 22Crub2.1]
MSQGGLPKDARRVADDSPLPVIVLTAFGLLATLFGAFLRIAPNRLLSGHAYSPHAWVLAAIWGIALAGAIVRWPGRRIVVGLLAWLAMTGLPLLAGIDAHAWLMRAAASTRVQLGAGFWLAWLAAALLLLDRLRPARRVVQVVAWFAALVAIAIMAAAGALDGLALVREYAAQRAPFADALLTHVAIAVVTLAVALLIGAPLGGWAWRAKRGGGALVGLLTFLQTVPSLALFALLIGPFAWLANAWPALGAIGFGGTGAAPAVFALVLYALLPVVRYTVAGLDAVAPEALEAAHGLGMSRWQVLARVQLPLGWPVLLAGLRIVAVQTIGLAAVAALIGAGGLGRFVFLGIGQGASDMVLLGTLAIIGLALAADVLFQCLLALTETPA